MQRISDFAVTKFTAKEILMIHKTTRKVYSYFQTKQIGHKLQCQHPFLSKAIRLETGLLYLRASTNLNEQLQKKIKQCSSDHFTEEQLINTFQPIYQCLAAMHKNGETHGNLHPNKIVVSNQAQIWLRDPLLIVSNNGYYNSQDTSIKPQHDYKALGLILYECATLQNYDHKANTHVLLESLVNRPCKYSKNLICLIATLLSYPKTSFKDLPILFAGQASEQLKYSIFKQFTEAQCKQNAALVNTPPSPQQKKFQPIILKKPYNNTDNENKRAAIGVTTTNQQKKLKPSLKPSLEGQMIAIKRSNNNCSRQQDSSNNTRKQLFKQTELLKILKDDNGKIKQDTKNRQRNNRIYQKRRINL